MNIKNAVKKALWILSGGYNPKRFWKKWGKNFISDPWQHKIFPQHNWLLKKIKKEKPKKILEVGCGFGRNIKFLLENGIEPKTIDGSDISATMLGHARKYLKGRNVKFFTADIEHLPFEDKSYDFVFVFAVLMHVDAQNVLNAIRELKRISRKHVAIIEQNYKPPRNDKASLYTFVHPYKALFKKCKLTLLDYKHGENGYNAYYLACTD